MTALRFASLGSGSRGNALLVEAGRTRVLIDNGFGLRETLRRLERLGIAPDSLTAVLLTHEHADHAAGVVPLAARYDLPIHLTAGTRWALAGRGHFDGAAVDCRRIVRGQDFAVGELTVSPVRVPHDAQEPCQFVLTCGDARLGVLTDVGSITPQMVAAYASCDALVLECNHDRQRLAAGPYPASLKVRVGGDFGHLSNCQAAAFLRMTETGRLQTLVVAHLSEKNNDVRLARSAAAAALGWNEERVVVADQAAGHDWLTAVAGARGAPRQAELMWHDSGA